jgi:hypothetical protein
VGVFLRKANGELVSLGRQGDPAPGGGNFRLSFGPILNERGDVVFIGDLTDNSAPTAFGEKLGVFLYRDGVVLPIARPGDPLPGGGKFFTTGFVVGCAHLNQRRGVTFNATIDTGMDDPNPAGLDVDGDGTPDLLEQGLYVWSDGVKRLVVKSGMQLPGIGTVIDLIPPDLLPQFPVNYRYPWSGTATNERGEIVLTAAVEDPAGGIQGLLLVASPIPPTFRRADTDVSGSIDLSDAVNLLNYNFLGGPKPECLDAADFDDDGSADISDAVANLSYQFLGTSAPPAPGPSVCGPDPNEEDPDLGCEKSCTL